MMLIQMIFIDRSIERSDKFFIKLMIAVQNV